MTKLHQNKAIREVLERLVRQGWVLREQGHRYYLLCPCGKGQIRVDGTPRNPEMVARIIARNAARCPDRHELDGQPSARGH